MQSMAGRILITWPLLALSQQSRMFCFFSSRANLVQLATLHQLRLRYTASSIQRKDSQVPTLSPFMIRRTRFHAKYLLGTRAWPESYQIDLCVTLVDKLIPRHIKPEKPSLRLMGLISFGQSLVQFGICEQCNGSMMYRFRILLLSRTQVYLGGLRFTRLTFLIVEIPPGHAPGLIPDGTFSIAERGDIYLGTYLGMLTSNDPDSLEVGSGYHIGPPIVQVIQILIIQ